jgi:hypothetical protein
MRHSILLFSLTALAACSSNSTSSEPHEVPASVDASANPPSHDASAPSDTSRFVGTWKVTEGSSLVTCPGMPNWPAEGMSLDDQGSVVHIEEGTSPGMITVHQEGAGCSFTYAVNGGVATLSAPSTCLPQGPQIGGCSSDAGASVDGGSGHHHDGGVTMTWLLTHDTLTLGGDGATFAEAYEEDLHDYAALCEGDSIVTYDCHASGHDTLTKQRSVSPSLRSGLVNWR